jgi:Lon protease-like protein
VSSVVLPIFPLPELTFFPHTLLPLHVFEARYRAMVTDVLARDKRLAVVGLKPGYEAAYDGRPPVYAVAGMGEVVNWERLPTGRYNILLKGDGRVRIERELPADTLYRMIVGEPLVDISPPEDPTASLDRVRGACRRLLVALGRAPRLLDDALRPGQPPGAIVDQIAAVLPDAAIRQELLETTDVGRRLDRLLTALGDLVRQITGES